MTIVRKDKVLAGYNGNLESVKVHDAQGELKEVPNGVLVTIGGLMEGEREVVKATLATKEDAGKELLLIHSPELMADERKTLADFVNPADHPARAYRLAKGDIITITDDLIVGEVKVGDEVTVADGGLYTKAEGASGEETGDTALFVVIEDAGDELALDTQAYAIRRL